MVSAKPSSVRAVLPVLVCWLVLVTMAAGASLEARASSRLIRRRDSRHGVALPSERRTSVDLWLELLSEYARSDPAALESARADGWVPKPFSVELPLASKDGRRLESLPVLVLPVPVSSPSRSSQQCNSRRFKTNNYFNKEEYDEDATEDWDEDPPQRWRDEVPAVAPAHRPARPPPPAQYPALRARPSPSAPLDLGTPAPTYGPGNSKWLLELYEAQVPTAPHLPPVVFQEPSPTATPITISSTTTPSPRRTYVPFPSSYRREPQTPVGGGNPSTLRFDRPLRLRAELTVPKADYTEPYTAWWNPSSGESRVDYHGGTTTTFQLRDAGGALRLLEMQLNRAEEHPLLVCGTALTTTEYTSSPLPDFNLFSFAGYKEWQNERAEVWRHAVRGGAGELGAAFGESLAYDHELLVSRASNNSVIPLKYTVSVNSSVLGDGFEGYAHVYVEAAGVSAEELKTALGAPEPATRCDRLEPLQPERPDHRARLQPLREFTLPHRDIRYDTDFDNFKKDFNRKYADEMEEALRKTLLIKNTRFCLSGNREGASFTMGTNFLSDRLEEELAVLRGVEEGEEHVPAESFPISGVELSSLAKTLPDEFDWRELGGVTPVRYQGASCSSCWAFAVTAAVEGALFINTRRLVPLSDKSLVDCAHTFGAKGCKGTWPSSAYDYIQALGIPALDEYTPYNEKVDQCLDDRVPPVTHISAHVNVTRNDIPAMKVAIKKYAPTVVVIDASATSFTYYKKGVYEDDRCDKGPKKRNHAVVAVGWGQQSGETHFIVKNSWSTAWGDGGYARMHAPSNTCGLLQLPSYPRLQRSDIDRADLATIRPSDFP